MKKYAWLWLVGAVSFLAVIGNIMPTPAFAGDDFVQRLPLTADGGTNATCSSLLTIGEYAVQPTVSAHVSVSVTGDGGVGVTTANNLLIGAYKVYDTYTTSGQKYICCKPAAAVALGTDGGHCMIERYREF